MRQESSRTADGTPLGEHCNEAVTEPETDTNENDNSKQGDSEGDEGVPARRKQQQPSKPAFAVKAGPSQAKGGPRSPEYVHVLDRYISRLVSQKQIPAALTVWRQEVERNPNHAGLDEEVGGFL